MSSKIQFLLQSGFWPEDKKLYDKEMLVVGNLKWDFLLGLIRENNVKWTQENKYWATPGFWSLVYTNYSIADLSEVCQGREVTRSEVIRNSSNQRYTAEVIPRLRQIKF